MHGALSYRLQTAKGSLVVAGERVGDRDERAPLSIDLGGGELRPGLINAHDHLHRNHYPPIGSPPYPDAYAWGLHLHEGWSDEIARGRAVPRGDALLFGALKNLLGGATTVAHHDRWEPDFDSDFPVRVVRLRTVHSLGFEKDPIAAARGPAELPLTIHLAEGTTQESAREVKRLADLGLLNAHVLAVHGVGLTRDGIARLVEAGAALVWCPTSNLFLFGRTAPARAFLARLDVLLGTDSLLTGRGTLLDELQAARRLALLDERRLADAVGDVAARRLGLMPPRLEPGRPADLVYLERPLLEARPEDVGLVVVRGTPLLGAPRFSPLFEHAGVQTRRLLVRGVEKLVAERLARAVDCVADHCPEAVRMLAVPTAAEPYAAAAVRPAVSVVVPTWNRGALLRRAVDSVLRQSHGDLELLVVDDGSTDDTAEFLRGVGDPRLTVIRLPHTGHVATARNAGAARASGRFLAFLDSDDLWMPDKVEVQLGAMAATGARWSYTRYQHVDAAGRPVPPRLGEWREHSGRIAADILEHRAGVSIVTVLLERELFERLGGFDETPGIREDLEFVVRLASAAEGVAVDRSLARVREHAGRTTSAMKGSEPHLVTAATYERLLAWLEGPPLRKAARRQLGEAHAKAASVHVQNRSFGAGLRSLGAALRAGASPLRTLSALRRGVGLDRRLFRRLIRPILGRESRAWGWIRSPDLRLTCFRDPVDCVLHALLVSLHGLRFVQIGSHDGRSNDPLWTFRRHSQWSGILVEPEPHAFERLQENYRPWRHRFTFERAAVAAHSGTRPFYHFKPKEVSDPGYMQVASLDAVHVSAHAARFGNPDVIATEVRCVTFDEIGSEHELRKPDLIHVDTEGHDAEILSQLDLHRHRPAVILFEHVHLNAAVRTAAEDRLRRAGYAILELRGDTLAVSKEALACFRPLRRAWRLVGGGRSASESAALPLAPPVAEAAPQPTGRGPG